MIIIDPPAPFEPLSVFRDHLRNLLLVIEQNPDEAEAIEFFVRNAEQKIRDMEIAKD